MALIRPITRLRAGNSTVSGAVSFTHEGTGELAAQAATVAGAGARGISGAGGLVAQASAVAGSSQSPVEPTGDLPGEIVVYNTSGGPNQSVALWGQEFERGALPSGSQLTASGWDVQTTVLATYSDGSARFAAMAARPLTAIESGQSRSLQLEIGSGASGSHIGTGDLPASQLAQIDLGSGLIAAVDRNDLAGSSSGRTWVRTEYTGPLCSCWIYQTPFNDGSDDDLLDAQFIVWAGPGGAILRQRATIENTRLNPASDGDRTVDITIDFLETQVLSEASRSVGALRRGSYFEDSTGFFVEKDLGYAARVAGVLPYYDPGSDTTANTNAISSDLSAIEGANYLFDTQFVTFSSSGAGREELAHFPGWVARALVDSDNPDGLEVMERVCSGPAGTLDIHYRDESTGLVPVLDDYLTSGNNWSSGLEGRNGRTMNNGVRDPAHFTSFGFAEYLWTADPYYREEAQMWGFWAGAWGSSSAAWSVWQQQIRAGAWGMRALVHAWWVCRDSESDLRSAFAGSVSTAASEIMDDHDVGGVNEQVIPFANMRGNVAAFGGNYTSQWQSTWLWYWCMQGYRLGLDVLKPLAEYGSRFCVEMMTHPEFRAALAAVSWPWVSDDYADEPPAGGSALVDTWTEYKESILYDPTGDAMPDDMGVSVSNLANALTASDADLYESMSGLSDARDFASYQGDVNSYIGYLQANVALSRDLSLPNELDADVAYRRVLTFRRPTFNQGDPQWGILSAVAESGPTTALGEAMRAAPLNTLTVFNPPNLVASMLESTGDSVPQIMTYMGGTQWDPINKRFHIIAKSAGGGEEWVHFLYDALANECSVVSRSTANNTLPGADAGGFGHMYDGVAVDPRTGYVYHAGLNQGNVGRFDGSSWSTIPAATLGVGGSTADTPVLKVHWGRNELLLARPFTGTLRVLDLTDDSVSSGGSISLGSVHPVGGYNPMTHELIFGGGDNGSGGDRVRTMYRYSNDGQLTQLDDLPDGYGVSVEDGAQFGVDYTTGETLIFWTNRSFSLANVLRLRADQSWVVESQPSGTLPSYGACCVTIPEYNGNVFVDYNGGSPRFLLYRTR